MNKLKHKTELKSNNPIDELKSFFKSDYSRLAGAEVCGE